MFESPLTSDTDLNIDFGSSTQHPFSIRSRLREVRDVFRGFRPLPSTVLHGGESRTLNVPLPRASDSTASSFVSKPKSLYGTTKAAFVPVKRPVKDAEVALQFLQEVLRTEKSEILIGSASAVFDAVLSYLATLKCHVPRVQDALLALLDWVENKILANDIYDDNDDSAHLVSSENDKNEGIRLIAELSKALAETSEVSTGAQHTNFSSVDKRQNKIGFSDLNSSGGFRGSTTLFSNHPFGSSENVNVSLTDQSLDDLLAQLNLRQVAKFEPVFPQMENDDTDEDDRDAVHEKREEREEKKDTKTCEEEVQRLSDGSEIRKRKTRTFNMQQNSKQVTVRSHGSMGDEIVNKFHDGDISFNDDVATDDFFTKARYRRGRNSLGGTERLDDLLESTNNQKDADEGISQKIKSVQHTDIISQKVSKTAKKNGKIIANDAAQKVDKSELNARQVETFKDDILLDRRGSGSYEESSTVKMGLNSISSSPPIPPKQRHVVQYMQTFGNEKEDRDDFFKGSTLASYIMLNDNLRYHEEQYRKKISFEFSVPGAAVRSQNFSELSHLLQYCETDRVMLPKRYSEVDEVASDGIPVTAPEDPKILKSVDVTDWLVLRSNDSTSKSNEVRGGPKDALICFATQPSGSLLYQESFLTTYRGFISSEELIQKLIKRYLYMCTVNEQQRVKVAHQTFSMLVRVVDELCPVEQTRKLICIITKFIRHLVKDENYTFARILRKRLMTRMDMKLMPKKKTTTEVSNLGNSRHLTIFDFRSSAIAKQMTFLDAELFYMIEPPEMLWWAQEQNENKSPNLCRFTEHFNKVSYWVRTIVLASNEQRSREKVMSKFVKIMKHLRTMGNYNSYLAILSALDSGPIRRLDWSKNITDLLKEHSVVMDSSHSFKNYRTLLAESHPPCLPYIGLVLQDLTFVHIGNSDYLPPEQCNGKKNLLNYGKRWQQFAILDSIRRFRSWNYSIEKDEKIIQFFDGFNNYSSEDEIWDLSETIKPRTRKNK